MKILHLANHFYPCKGGVEQHLKDLCKALVSLGYKSDVLCLNTCSNSKERLKYVEEIDGSLVMRVKYKDLKYYKISDIPQRKLKSYDCIHVHGMGFFLDWVCLTKFLHKKHIVFTTHGGIFHTKNISLVKRMYFAPWKMLIARKIDRTIAVSKQDKKMFSFLNPVLIPPSVYLPNESGEKQSGSILVLGRIAPNKRIEDILHVVSLLGGKREFKVKIAGSDWNNSIEELKQKCRELGIEDKVEFLGEVTDEQKKELYKTSEIFLSASSYEGFGISLLEAMASGCIPLVNSIETYREILDDDKRFLVNFSDHKKAAEALKKIFNMKNKDSVSAHVKKMSKLFSIENSIDKITKIYEEFK